MCKCMTQETGVYVEACYADKLRYATAKRESCVRGAANVDYSFGNQLLDQQYGGATLPYVEP